MITHQTNKFTTMQRRYIFQTATYTLWCAMKLKITIYFHSKNIQNLEDIKVNQLNASKPIVLYFNSYFITLIKITIQWKTKVNLSIDNLYVNLTHFQMLQRVFEK